MVIYNPLDRPRVAVTGCPEDHPVVEAVRALGGSYFVGPLIEQPLQDRDLVVVWQDPHNGAGARLLVGGRGQDHLRVVQFGGDPVSVWSPSSGAWMGPRLSDVLGDELLVADGCPPELRRLVREVLLPLLTSRGSSHVSIRSVWGPSERATFTPLATTSNGEALAAIYTTPQNQEVWWLPVHPDDADTFDFEVWLRAATEAWHTVDPERFPGPPDWTRSKDWMTAEEILLNGEVEKARCELDETYAKLKVVVEERVATLEDAQMRHDAGERRLLTAQADELVTAVKAMLERVGFQVEDCDETRTGQKLEDLRVRDPDSEWLALAEVKGHLNAGGKPGEIAKLTRFVGIYEGKTGSLPDASWYIVNQYASKPPDRRRPLMSNHSEDVEEFSRDVNGVVIDTKDLFVLDREVATNKIDKKRAREILMTANQQLRLDTHEDDGNAPVGGTSPTSPEA